MQTHFGSPLSGSMVHSWPAEEHLCFRQGCSSSVKDVVEVDGDNLGQTYLSTLTIIIHLHFTSNILKTDQ